MTKLTLVELDLQLDDRERAVIEHIERGPKIPRPRAPVIPLYGPVVIDTKPSRWREFWQTYADYRAFHGRRYSLWIAWQIAVRGTPF
jgi:hypothetical protein